MFKEYYNHQFREIFDLPLQPSDGLSEETVQTKLTQQGLIIPQALFDYYVLAGNHWINKNHNCLLNLEELQWIDDKLVFMEENQVTTYWGILKADVSQADPIVWQGINADSVEWYEENYQLSEFLMSMWKWTIS